MSRVVLAELVLLLVFPWAWGQESLSTGPSRSLPAQGRIAPLDQPGFAAAEKSKTSAGDYARMLSEAAETGDAAKAREALAGGLGELSGAAALCLYEASARGHLEVVKILLAATNQVDVHREVRIRRGLAQNDERTTALHGACECGWPEVVQALLEAGVLVDDRRTSGKMTALEATVRKWVRPNSRSPSAGSGHSDGEKRAWRIARLLLEKGAEIDSASGAFSGQSALINSLRVGRLDWTEFLLSYGRLRPRAAKERDSYFHLAARYGLTNAVRPLLQRGYGPNERNGDGFTALHLAALYDPNNPPIGTVGSPAERKLVLAELLLAAGARPDVFTSTGLPDRAALQAFIDDGGHGHEARDASGRTPLHWAARLNHADLVRFWLDHGVDIHAVDPEGRTALHEACESGGTNAVTVLLHAGASPSQADQAGQTPLHAAIENRRRAVVLALLEAHADINAVDREGATPMDLAASTWQRDIILLLIDRGAKVDRPSGRSFTALHAAASAPDLELARTLLRKGAPADVADNEGQRPLDWALSHGDPRMVELLLKHGADLESRDKDGNTRLHRFCQPGFSDEVVLPPTWWDRMRDQALNKGLATVLPIKPSPARTFSLSRFLLSRGFNPNATNQAGRTPLHMMGECAQFSAMDDSADADLAQTDEAQVVARLVAAGARMDARDRDGLTPLHVVARCGSRFAARILLANGADPNVRAADGRTPLHLAAQAGHAAIAALLVRHGAIAEGGTSGP